MDFGFSFDAVPTIDMVLYFRRSMKKDGDECKQRRLKRHEFK